jgi:hypothetical protein
MEETDTIKHDVNVKSKSDECIELKNIKYKTMLLNGNSLHESKQTDNLSNLDKFLEDDKNNNQNEPWSKLDKTIKTKKLLLFSEYFSKENNFTDEEKHLLVLFLKDCLDRKRLQRVKDVNYDKTTGEIKTIPSLFYNKEVRHFTLKNQDRRVSTVKNLAPKKARNTIKNFNTVDIHNNSSDSD